MKTIGFILLSLVLIAMLVGAAAWLAAPSQMPAADRETFERANQLYQAGNYAAAASLYEQLTARGIANADLYYNLGSAYQQAGQPKPAAEAFAKAAQLAPRDAQIAGKAPVQPKLPLTGNELALGALVLVSALALALVGGRRGAFGRHGGVTA